MTGKFWFLLLSCGFAAGMNLTKVLLVSRHSLRTPLTLTLDRMTPKVWPKWDKAPGELTSKGAVLEGHMGEYFGQWIRKEGLLPTKSNGCPETDTVHIYANTRQRTKATAKAFTQHAFPECDIAVNYKNITEMDPIFNPVIHNMTEAFKNAIIQEMQEKLASIDLKDAYKELNRITDIKNSLICKEDKYCDLAEDKDEVVFEIGLEPNVSGPLFIGNSMVDAFLMSFYEGLPLSEIGWGEIKSKEQWHLISKLTRENQNVRFLTTAAKDLTRPLLKYMEGILESDIRFSLLVGHDSNLSPIMKSLEFKTYELPEQLELTPIGSKLVFQKWTDGNEDYLKIEMIYQSMSQLRKGELLSLRNPPKRVTMEIKKCPTDSNGFCPWNTFIEILKDVVE